MLIQHRCQQRQTLMFVGFDKDLLDIRNVFFAFDVDFNG